MLIMIAGPFRSGSNNRDVWAENLKKMNELAYQVFLKGHTPVIGVNAALPIIEFAGEDEYDNIMMPISLRLAEKCDAILRTNEPSKGADQELDVFVKKGLPVYYNLSEIPA